jgi:hypothetical protein
MRAYPHGFLVEKSQNVLDNKVVFQFNTVSLDDHHAMQPIKRDFSVASVLESRMIEVNERIPEFHDQQRQCPPSDL